jgi:hypothetical protein
VPRLQLAGLEGDAAFLYVREPEDEEVARSVAAVAAEMHRAFHAEQGRLAALTLCRCSACQQIGSLTVKAVAHLGEVAEQTVRDQTTLAGTDVILVHRMLKNSVPIAEYVLVTEAVFRRLGAEARSGAVAIDEELEGLGTERLYYLDVTTLVGEPLPPPRASLPKRLTMTGGQVARSVPYLLGLKRLG